MTPASFNAFLANICSHTSLWMWIIFTWMSWFISSCCIEWLALHYYTVVDMDIHLVKYFWLTGSLEGMYHFVCVHFCLCSGLHMSIYMDAWGRWFSLGHSSINRATQQPIRQYYQTPSVEGMQNPYSIEIHGPCKIQASLATDSIHDDYWSTNDFWLYTDVIRWLTPEKCHFQFGGWAHFPLIP